MRESNTFRVLFLGHPVYWYQNMEAHMLEKQRIQATTVVIAIIIHMNYSYKTRLYSTNMYLFRHVCSQLYPREHLKK